MTEQQAYEVVQRYPDFEVRRYPAHMVAQTSLVDTFERAGNAAFRPLADYIFGGNVTSRRLAMTAPVIQEPQSDGEHRVAFVLPADDEGEGYPAPTSARVRLVGVPEELAAVVSFSGRWTEASYERHLAALTAAVHREGLVVAGRPRYARFDPPWKPAFLRRNEVVLPIAQP